MKVLNIGMDRRLFDEDSSVFLMHKLYAKEVEEFHVIVFSLKKHSLKKINSEKLYIYPTNSQSRLGFLFDAYKIGKKIIQERGFKKVGDVLTAQDPMTLVVYFLSKKFQLPFQMQIHTDLFAKGFKNSLVTWKNFWYSGWTQIFLDNFLIPRANRLRVVSSVIRDSLVEKYPNMISKIDILPIWVDVEKMQRLVEDFYPIELKGDSILMLSRFSKEKRIDLALNAFKKAIDKSKRNLKLKIVGAGPEKENIIKIVKELSLDSQVEIIEWDKDPIRLYKNYDVFLLTSEYEGYGMTLIEAGASGCPIVTTEVGVAKTDLFKDGVNSYVCPVGDVDCLSDRLVSLLNNEDKRKSFSQNMKESIKNIAISREEYVTRYISLLSKLIK